MQQIRSNVQKLIVPEGKTVTVVMPPDGEVQTFQHRTEPYVIPITARAISVQDVLPTPARKKVSRKRSGIGTAS